MALRYRAAAAAMGYWLARRAVIASWLSAVKEASRAVSAP